MKHTTLKTAILYLGLLSFFGIIGALFAAYTHPLTRTQTASAASAFEAPQPEFSLAVPPHFQAKSAYVYDLVTRKILFNYHMDAQLPLASLTKIALILLAQEKLDLTTTVPITARSLLPEGDWGLVVGDSWNTTDLIQYTLMVSSNDGAAAIAEAIERATGSSISTLLNDFATTQKLHQTYFLNPTGLDVSTALSGAYGSAQDVGTLLVDAYRRAPNLFSSTARPTATFTSASGLIYTATNTDMAINNLPGLVLGKTGYTDLAGGNLGVVVETEPGHPIVIVVLGSTKQGRFSDVTALLRAVHNQALPPLVN